MSEVKRLAAADSLLVQRHTGRSQRQDQSRGQRHIIGLIEPPHHQHGLLA